MGSLKMQACMNSRLLQPVQVEPDGWLVCLCAEWCNVCREFRPAFEALALQYPGWRVLWIDVEDEEDIVGEVEVETFPTVLVADGRQARFFGPVLPQAGMLTRLVDNVQAGEGGAPCGSDIQQLLQRLWQGR